MVAILVVNDATCGALDLWPVNTVAGMICALKRGLKFPTTFAKRFICKEKKNVAK